MVIGLCDDALEVRQKYEELFKKILDEEGKVATIKLFKSGDQVIFNIDEVIASVDILFLDIRMPGTDGLKTAEKLREKGYGGEIIFLTNSKEDVFNAFDVKAFHYIVKGARGSEGIRDIFLRAIAQVEERKQEYIILSGIGEHRSIPLAQIRYFEIDQRLVTVYYGEGETFEFVSTMAKLDTQLFNKGFFRIGKSYLVALAFVESFSYEKVTMEGGRVLPIGRKYYKEFKETMKSKYGK